MARTMPKKPNISWLEEPEDHDYPAAESFLRLTYDARASGNYVRQLRAAPVLQFKAKDIFRASGLSLLGVSNSHVEKDIEKIRDGKDLSPLLLVRHTPTGRVIVADGYHRLCAVYSLDEDALIPAKIVG
jgi:disulfide oxidoreductase YuzD